MIEKIFITSFIVFGIYATMQPGMIFGTIQDWYWKTTKDWSEEKANFISKPIFSCCVCMGFWHGIYIYWAIWHNSWYECLTVVVAEMGLNYVLSRLFRNG